MTVNRLYVGNLSYSTTNSQLEELFSKYGEVVSVNIIGTKGFGFVEMSSVEEAQSAKENLDNTEFMSRVIKVDEARPPKKRPEHNNNFSSRRRW